MSAGVCVKHREEAECVCEYISVPVVTSALLLSC